MAAAERYWRSTVALRRAQRGKLDRRDHSTTNSAIDHKRHTLGSFRTHLSNDVRMTKNDECRNIEPFHPIVAIRRRSFRAAYRARQQQRSAATGGECLRRATESELHPIPKEKR